MQMRTIIFSMLAFGALAGTGESIAQPWKPTRSVEIIVGSGPGGGADITGRLMQKQFQEKLLTDVATSVVNKTGGASTLSFIYLNQHPGDAHYIALTLQPMITGPLMIADQIKYTDMTPLAHLINEYVGFGVRPDAPYKTGRDVIERLKKDPKSLSIGLSTALAGSNHLATVLALKAAGVDIKKLRVVVVKGSTEAVAGVMGGHLDIAAGSAAGMMRRIRQRADMERAGCGFRVRQLARRRRPERDDRAADRILGRRVRETRANAGMARRTRAPAAGPCVSQQPRHAEISRSPTPGTARSAGRSRARQIGFSLSSRPKPSRPGPTSCFPRG